MRALPYATLGFTHASLPYYLLRLIDVLGIFDYVIQVCIVSVVLSHYESSDFVEVYENLKPDVCN